MKKTNLKNTLLSITLGLVLLLSFFPTNIGKVFANAEKNVYKEPATIDVSGSFESTTTTTPDKWSISSSYNNELNSDSTSFNGVISTNPNNWQNFWVSQLDALMTEWDKAHEFTIDASKRTEIINQIKGSTALPTNPLVEGYNADTTTDFKVLALMAGVTYTQYLDSSTGSVALLSNAREGYVKYTSEEFSLDAYSFYKITVAVNTNSGAIASISLSGDIDKTLFNSVSSDGAWTTYTAFVSTTTLSKVKLGLALGESNDNKSGGNVFFDNVKVEKIQLLDFVKNAIPNSTTAISDNREILSPENASSQNYTVVDDFEGTRMWEPLNTPYDDIDIRNVEESQYTDIKETFPQNNYSGVNKMLRVTNNKSSEITLNSTKFELTKGRYYRVSFWAYSSESSATLKAILVSKNVAGKELTVEESTSPYLEDRDKENTSNINNFWVNYVFYVEAPAEENVEAYIKLTIPAGKTLNFDNFTTEYVSKQEYTDTTAKKLSLKTEVKDETITNGTFHTYDSVKVSDYSELLPATGWTATKKFDIYEYYGDATSDKVTKALLAQDITINSEKTQITYNGKTFVKVDGTTTYNYSQNDIVKEKINFVENKELTYDSTKTAYTHKDYQDLKIDTLVSAGIDISNPNYNALKFNSSSDTLTYKSSVIKLSSNNSLYIISANIKTEASAYMTLRLVDKDGNIFGSISEINTPSGDFKTYKFYVGTGLETIELYLEIEYTNSYGVAEVKNLMALKTTSTTVLDNKIEKVHADLITDGIAVVDLRGENFTEHANQLNDSTKLYDATLYKANAIEGKTSGIYGILDTSAPHANFNGIKAKEESTSPYVLIIKNAGTQSTELKAVKQFTVAKQKYMLITITARVDGLTEGKTASINFPALNKTFNVTAGEYTEFKLYIDNKTNDKEFKVDYSFAILDSAGTLVVDSIKVETPSDISSVKSEFKNKDTELVKFAKTTDKADDSSSNSNNTNADDINKEDENKTLEIFLAVLSSLLLVASIIFAIVFTRVKALHRPRKRGQKNKVGETDDGTKGFV